MRAITPSTLSLKMNSVTTRVPTRSWPRGKNASAPTQTPSVPTTVTTSGLMPRRRNSLAIGVMTLVQVSRRSRLSMVSSSLSAPSRSTGWPRLHETGPHVLQQHRQCLGPGDDGQEVGVATPPRHDVLVQVGGDSGTGDGALVHAEVEAHRGAGVLQRPQRPLRQRGELRRLLVGEVDVERDVAVGTDQHVTRGVGEE